MANAQSRVELIVEAAKAINPLRKVEAQTKKLDQALKKNQKAARDVEAAFQRMGRRGIRSIRDLEANANRLGRTMGGLRGAVGKAVVGFAAFKSIQGGIERIESERKLRLLSREFGEIEHVQAAAGRAAKRFGLSQTEANQALGKIYARLRPVGIGLADIESTFNGFNTAAKLAGATAGESAGAFLQLSQALGSGYLRGQELNSVLEQAPLIGIAIAKEMGVAVGELKNLGAEGKITSATVIKALKRIETEGADKLKEAMGGPGQAVKNFQNAIEDLQVAVTKDAMPQLTTAFSELAVAIKELAPALRIVGQIAAQVFSYIGGLAKRTTDMLSGSKRAQAEIQASAQGQQLTRERFGVLGMFSPEAQAFRSQVEKNFMFNFDAQQRMASEAAAAATNLPSLPFTPLPEGASSKDGKGKKKTKSPLERQQELLQDILREEENRRFLLTQTNEKQRVGAEYLVQTQDIQRDLNLLSEDKVKLALDEAKGTYLAQLAVIDKKAEEKAAADAKLKALKAEQAEAQRLQQIYGQIGSTISSGVVGMLEAAFDSTKSLADAALNMLQNLANQLLQVAVNSTLFGVFGGGSFGASLFGGLPRFADGGSISGGKPAIVGERGPELFMPGRSGSIVPNDALGGNHITVNVDASGSSVEGSADQAGQLGKAIGLAVQQELLKQKRPGGLLAGV